MQDRPRVALNDHPHARAAIVFTRDLFTDREDARALFEAALDKPQTPDEHRALVWYGVGGQGKTALQAEFGRILANRRTVAKELWAKPPGFALVDFQTPDNLAIANALLSIRLQLGGTASLKFPAFDLAFARFFSLTQPGKNLKALHPQLFSTGSAILDDLLGFLNGLGILGDAVHGFSWFSILTKHLSQGAGKLAHWFVEWWDRRGRRVLYGIDELSQDQLLRKLPTYLGADLVYALEADHSPRLVVQLDTYEALWSGRGLKDGQGALLFDDWVRLLVQDSPGVLFVITGRDGLRWGEIDADWNDILDQHPLGGLSIPDADRLLLKCEVAEAGIRARMIEGAASREAGGSAATDGGTEACLPFYLELQVLTYWHIKAAGLSPAPDDFGGDHSEILSRFLNHLDNEMEKLLRLASYPKVLSTPVLEMLAERFLGVGAAGADWPRLFERSFVSPARDGERVLHGLMREALQEREQVERPELYRDIHRALYDWYETRCRTDEPKAITVVHERAFVAAARHLAEVDERDAVRWINRQMQRFNDAARWRTLEEACRIAMPLAERAFGPENEWTTSNLLWLAGAYSNNGRYGEAEQLYERVRAICEKTLGAEHPSTATTLHSLARVYSDTGRYGDAEQLYEQVRAIYEKTLGAEHPSTATTLHSLAGVYRDTGRYAEAEQLYERVRAIEEKTLGAEHPSTATTLASLAGVYMDTGRYAEAEQLYERVRVIQEKTLGAEHPSTATTLHSLARVYSDTGRYAEAEKLYERVRAICEKTLGAEHPSTATTLHSLARVYSDTGRYGDAEQLYEQVRAIYEKTLGAEHPSTATTLHSLAGVYSETGRYGEAEQLYEQVRAIYEKRLGAEHPWTATTLHNLAGVYSDTGRYGEAERLYGQVRAIYEKTWGPSIPRPPRRLAASPACTATPAATPKPKRCSSNACAFWWQSCRQGTRESQDFGWNAASCTRASDATARPPPVSTMPLRPSRPPACNRSTAGPKRPARN